MLSLRYNTMFLIVFALSLHLTGQEKIKYRDLVFSHAERQKNLYYGDSAKPRQKAYFMDLYGSDKDTGNARPVIVLMHGGGFKFGSKNISRMKIWGRRFAKMGYLCVAINYRLSSKKPLSRFEDLAEGCLEASEDALRAVQWLKSNWRILRIDTSRIVLGGHSAGGMIALQSVYSSNEEIKALLSSGTGHRSGGKHNPGQIAAIINFWGAIYDTTWLANAKVPIVSVHGSKDRVVPINFKTTPMFGSAAIHRTADRLGISNALKVYQGKGHELQKHFNPIYAGPVARRRWRESADFAAAFLFRTLW